MKVLKFPTKENPKAIPLNEIELKKAELNMRVENIKASLLRINNFMKEVQNVKAAIIDTDDTLLPKKPRDSTPKTK